MRTVRANPSSLCPLAALLALTCLAASSTAQTWPELQEVPMGVETHALAMSADGETVVGYYVPFSGPPRAFMWSNAGGGGQDLGLSFARATGVSSDGSVVYGVLPAEHRAFRWTQETGAVPFDPFGPGEVNNAGGCNADGSFFTGTRITSTLTAFRWGELGARDIIGADGEGAFGGGFGIYGGISYSGQSVITSVNHPVELPGRGLFGRTIPKVWTPGGTTPLWNGPLEETALAVAISGDGLTVAGSIGETGVFGPLGRGVIWPLGGTMIELGPNNVPYSVSGDGKVVGGNGWFHTVADGIVQLNPYLDQLGIDRMGWNIREVVGLSLDGQRMVANVSRSGGAQSVVWISLQQDSDGDSLYDDWELNGIPYIDHAGSVQRVPLPGANILRKDLYVELDSMTGAVTMDSAVARVAEVFDTAPVPAPDVDVPGGLPGVSLHVELDDIGTIPNQTLDWPPFFAAKSLFFGTATERARADWTQRKAAKAMAYRYCIVGQRIVGGFAGVGELNHEQPPLGPRKGGNDLMVALNDYVPRPGRTLEDKKALTFMHELGHTLGLYHGGGDAWQNHNPNHLSCMNYMWSAAKTTIPGQPPILLDYSREALPPLNEAALDESLGIQGPSPSLLIPIIVRKPLSIGWCDDFNNATDASRHGTCHSPRDARTCYRYVRATGSVDWNNDGLISGTLRTVCADPNDDLHTQTLVSVNEWSLLAYGFRDSVYYSDNAPLNTAPPCNTIEADMALEDLPDPPPPPQCPVPPPTSQPTTPLVASTCQQESAEFTANFDAVEPFTLQWSWRDDSQQPPVWVTLNDELLPTGTSFLGTQSEKLQIQNPHKEDFGADTVHLRCRITDVCGQQMDTPESLLLIAGAAATAASPQTLAPCPGSSASFSVAASTVTGPLTYSWELDSEALSDGARTFGTIVQGSTTDTVTLSNIDPRDFDWYSWAGFSQLNCRVLDTCGGPDPVYFTLYPGGVGIVTNPQSLNLDCGGDPQAVFTVDAVGPAPLVYRWEREGVPLADDAHVSGSNTRTLTITVPQHSDAGDYVCRVSSACGSTSSFPVPLYIGPPRVRVDPPALEPVCLGAFAVLSVDVLGASNYTMQWMKNGVDIPDGYLGRFFGPQSPSMLIVDVQPGDLDLYSVRLEGTCGTTVSQQALLELAEPIVITTQPVDQRVCPGGEVVLNIAAGPQAGLQYRWRAEFPPQSGEWVMLGDGELDACAFVAGTSTPALGVSLTGAAGCPTSLRFDCQVMIGECQLTSSSVAQVSLCRADVNCSGALTVQDIFDFLSYYFAGDPRGDHNTSGALTVQDIFDFLAGYFAGCP